MNQMDIRPKKKCDVCEVRTGWYTRCVECHLHICQRCSYLQTGCHKITCENCQLKHMDGCDDCRYETDTDCKDDDSPICSVCNLAEQHICTDCYKGVCGLHIFWCRECEQKICINCYPVSGICYQCIEYQEHIKQNRGNMEQLVQIELQKNQQQEDEDEDYHEPPEQIYVYDEEQEINFPFHGS